MGMDVSKTLTLSSEFDTVMSRLNTAQSDVSSDVSQNIDFLLLDKQRELNVLNVKYEHARTPQSSVLERANLGTLQLYSFTDLWSDHFQHLLMT